MDTKKIYKLIYSFDYKVFNKYKKYAIIGNPEGKCMMSIGNNVFLVNYYTKPGKLTKLIDASDFETKKFYNILKLGKI